MKTRKILFPIIFLCFVILFLVEKVKYIRLRGDYDRTKLSLMILKKPSVLDVKLFPDPDDDMYLVRILFDNGGSLEVFGVNENGAGCMEIFRVDNYAVMFCPEKIGLPINRTKKMQLYREITGDGLATITDIVEKYHIISRFVNNLPDLNDFKNDGDKDAYEVIARLIYFDKPFLNNIFLIDGSKCHLFKIKEDILRHGWPEIPGTYGGRS
jgi:hypothetical protein